MTTWNKVAGDIGDTITVTLGGIVTLDAVTAVEAHVWTKGVAPVVLDAAVLDAAACTIEVELGGVAGWLATAAYGRWSIEYELTFADGSKLTWPQMGSDLIVVRPDYDPETP